MPSLSESKHDSYPCRVAIVGLGTVGRGVAEILWQHEKEDNNAVQLAGILEKNQENQKKIRKFKKTKQKPEKI